MYEDEDERELFITQTPTLIKDETLNETQEIENIYLNLLEDYNGESDEEAGEVKLHEKPSDNIYGHDEDGGIDTDDKGVIAKPLPERFVAPLSHKAMIEHERLK
jgi:hypothetical protein